MTNILFFSLWLAALGGLILAYVARRRNKPAFSKSVEKPKTT